MARLLMAKLESKAARIVGLALFGYTWLQISSEDLSTRLVVRVLAGPISGHRIATSAGAQGLVEWSLAAAVLAFVGLAAWRLAGTAINDAVNRMIGSLNQAGV